MGYQRKAASHSETDTPKPRGSMREVEVYHVCVWRHRINRPTGVTCLCIPYAINA
jgi:hypothetical protein